MPRIKRIYWQLLLSLFRIKY